LAEIVGKLEFSEVRNTFKKEPSDFTVWMEEHIDALAERLQLKLTVLEREAKVGDFQVDLLCEDEVGNRFIIENQLERTDHDHLGKLLTYLVNLDAKTATWVTPNPRQEHEKVIDWLNEVTQDEISFYLVKVELVRIEGSPWAPLFTIISQPDKQAKQVGQKKKELSGSGKLKYDFWYGLLKVLSKQTRLFFKRNPTKEYWLSIGAGKSGVSLVFILRKDSCSIQLEIDYDKESGEKNKLIFDSLLKLRVDIEKEMGKTLEWKRRNEDRRSDIALHVLDKGWSDREEWLKMQEQMAEFMIRFDKAFRKRLKAIDI